VVFFTGEREMSAAMDLAKFAYESHTFHAMLSGHPGLFQVKEEWDDLSQIEKDVWASTAFVIGQHFREKFNDPHFEDMQK
jgi:hypothetical protein